VVVAAAVLAAGCGGDGDDAAPPAPEPGTAAPADDGGRAGDEAGPGEGADVDRGADGGGGGAAEPGALVRAEERRARDVPDGAHAWDVSYRSLGVDGELVTVTGVVYAPAGEGGGARPVVSWAHGTTGVADACAPSATGTSVHGLSALLEEGYVVAATDYEGLGTPGTHPYLVGDSAARSVLDAARAARQVDGAGAGDSPATLVYGHSQGGHAALFAAELAPSYAPDLDVVGVAAVAPPIDLGALVAGAAGTPFAFGFFVSAAVGYAAAYPELDLADVLTPAGVRAAAVVDSACLAVVLGAFLSEPVRTFLATDPDEVPAWAARIEENVPTVGEEPVPTLVLQGDQDPLVAAASTVAGVERLCEDGAPVDLRRYGQADHGSVLSASEEEVRAWFADRLAGDPAGSTC
jgi:alpha-beta hydrolase superfamily lysophospholipase